MRRSILSVKHDPIKHADYFWIFPTGELLPVNGNLITQIKSDLEYFDLTEEYVNEILLSTGDEGLIQCIIKMGWALIRYCDNYYSIELSHMTLRFKDIIWEWANGIINERINALVKIRDHDTDVILEYPIKEIIDGILFTRKELCRSSREVFISISHAKTKHEYYSEIRKIKALSFGGEIDSKILLSVIMDLKQRNLEEEYGVNGGKFGVQILDEGCDGYNKGTGYKFSPIYKCANNGNKKNWISGTPCFNIINIWKMTSSISKIEDFLLSGLPYDDFIGDEIVLIRGYEIKSEKYKNDVVLADAVILEVLYKE